MTTKKQTPTRNVKTTPPGNFIAKLESGRAEFPKDVPATLKVLAALEKATSRDAAAIVLLRTLMLDLTEASPAFHATVGDALDRHMLTVAKGFAKCAETFTTLRRAMKADTKANDSAAAPTGRAAQWQEAIDAAKRAKGSKATMKDVIERMPPKLGAVRP